jgi:hypothetical protein
MFAGGGDRTGRCAILAEEHACWVQVSDSFSIGYEGFPRIALG